VLSGKNLSGTGSPDQPKGTLSKRRDDTGQVPSARMKTSRCWLMSASTPAAASATVATLRQIVPIN
jgi:hypothetical protein